MQEHSTLSEDQLMKLAEIAGDVPEGLHVPQRPRVRDPFQEFFAAGFTAAKKDEEDLKNLPMITVAPLNVGRVTRWTTVCSEKGLLTDELTYLGDLLVGDTSKNKKMAHKVALRHAQVEFKNEALVRLWNGG